jgi:amino acid transporter
MISGCALIIDYVLTITLSISSGTDAIFSFLPVQYHTLKLTFALAGVGLLILMNLRGVKESVMSLTPFFAVFMITHVFAIAYVLITHGANFSHVAGETANQLHSSVSQLGLFGTIFLILKAYSMGAGTYTGIEAVSNGLPILREPKVQTARKTMTLMAISLSVMVLGLMIAYSLYNVKINPNKTLNAVLLENITAGWGHGWGYGFVLITLVSEATIWIYGSRKNLPP